MSLANAVGALLKPQTPLQQLLEDINFQRTKEMRQMLKDDSGFVVLQGTTYWTDLFVRHFLFQSEPAHAKDSDDLLFFVRKKHVKSSSRHMPKYETQVEVFRKDSRKLPIGDPDVDWEETLYLNMIIHQFDYTLTLAICTRTSPKELQVLRRHSQRVYASPSRRKMDTKGEGEEITYPHICFMVDNFDEVFSDILVRDGEMVCVELVANDKDGSVQGVIFLGSIRYDALKKVYDARQSSLSTKVAQRMSFGLFSSGAAVQTRCEFVRMKGPQGKGHAEMAVTKPKGSGVETPTSEPGFCATDMWDDWEEENDDYCTYRHQRRLSDPSANLNNFSRYGWRTKAAQDASAVGAGAKARSENEGLDSLANEVSEIEAGDLRDDQRSAFSASQIKLHLNAACDDANNEMTGTVTATKATVITTSDIRTNMDHTRNETKESVTAEADTSTDTNASSSGGSTTGCSNCFSGKKCKRWVSTSKADKSTPQMSEIYCPTCDDDTANETPACLNKMPDKSAKSKHRSILSVDSELIISKRGRLQNTEKSRNISGFTRSVSLSATERRSKKSIEGKVALELKEISKVRSKEKEIVKEKLPTAAKANARESDKKLKDKDKDKSKQKENDKSKEKEKQKTTRNSLLAKVSPKRNKTISTTKVNNEKNEKSNKKNLIQKTQQSVINNNNTKKASDEETRTTEASKQLQVYEIADDATSLNGAEFNDSVSEAKMAVLSESDTELMISVHGREELPVVEQSATTATNTTSQMNPISPISQKVPVEIENHPLNAAIAASAEKQDMQDNTSKIKTNSSMSLEEKNACPLNMNSDCNGNCEAIVPLSSATSVEAIAEAGNDTEVANSTDDDQQTDWQTLPRVKRSNAQQAYMSRVLNLVPKRRTPDGTNIYYWCDLPKKALKELDDGAYNPLWASRGFTQTFHFWKENRRQQSTPLNAFLTYVTLPWWSIAKDLLDHRETPILTF